MTRRLADCEKEREICRLVPAHDPNITDEQKVFAIPTQRWQMANFIKRSSRLLVYVMVGVVRARGNLDQSAPFLMT